MGWIDREEMSSFLLISTGLKEMSPNMKPHGLFPSEQLPIVTRVIRSGVLSLSYCFLLKSLLFLPFFFAITTEIGHMPKL